MKNDKDYDNFTDIIRSHTWILKNDNILILNGLNYSIKQLDTDILQSLYSSSRLINAQRVSENAIENCYPPDT